MPLRYLFDVNRRSEGRFYFYSSAFTVVLAILTLTILSQMGVSEGQIANIMTLIVGFSVVVTSNYKMQTSLDLSMEQARLTAIQAKLHADKVTSSIYESTEKVTSTLTENVQAVASNAKDVREKLELNESVTGSKLETIKHLGEENKSIGSAVHSLVNDHMTIALKANLELAREMQRISPSSGHKILLERAEMALDEHAKAEAEVARQEQENREKGFPDANQLKKDYEEGIHS
jgi:uncharacterized protein YoxC